MNVRRPFLLAIAVAAILVGYLFWHAKKPVEPPPTVSAETNSSAIPTDSVLAVRASAPTNQMQNPSGAGVSAPSQDSKEERVARILSTYNDVPIDFYGKLEDQFGNPVADANVQAAIMVNNGKRESTDHSSTTSAANGLFEFHGRGERIGVTPGKKGYALASTNNGGIYSQMWPEEERKNSEPSRPIVIKMWKLQAAEPLLSIDQHYQLGCTPAPVNFDLLAGAIVPNGGDIVVTINRPSGLISTRNQQDWSLTIQAVGGGLIKTSMAESRITYSAPDNGYQPSATFVMESKDNTWFEAIHQFFFVNSRNGQILSKINFSFRLNEKPDGLMSIGFKGVANTNRSSNWEGDPNTMAFTP